MTSPSDTSPIVQTITARVHGNAINRVPKLFTDSLCAIFTLCGIRRQSGRQPRSRSPRSNRSRRMVTSLITTRFARWSLLRADDSTTCLFR